MYEDHPETPPSSRGWHGALLSRAGLDGASPVTLAGIALLVVAALIFAGWRFGALLTGGEASDTVFEAGTEQGGPPADDPAPPRADGDTADAAEEPGSIWVHVAGAVRTPGLYEFAAGSRIGAAIEAAGGPGEDAALDAVNLACILDDGQQVYVPTRAEVEAGVARGPDIPASGTGSSGVGQAGALLDINTATEAELVTLPGVGPATAAKIVQDREANGPFSTPEEIMRVSGIGEKKYESMRDLITVR